MPINLLTYITRIVPTQIVSRYTGLTVPKINVSRNLYFCFELDDDASTAAVAAAKASDVNSTSLTLTAKNSSEMMRNIFASTPANTPYQSFEKLDNVSRASAEKPLTTTVQTQPVGYTGSLPDTIKLPQLDTVSSRHFIVDDQVSFVLAATFYRTLL